MKVRKAQALWRGDLKSGNGTVQFGDTPTRMKYSFASRFEEGDGTNPEELIGAALSGCYAMALAHELAQSGKKPVRIDTTSSVHLQKGDHGFEIPKIILKTEAEVNGIEIDEFSEVARNVAAACPIARALKNVVIEVESQLV